MWPGLKWLQIGTGAAAGFALCWLIHLVVVAGLRAEQGRALNDQKTALEAACAADKQLTEESNRDYREELRRRDDELAAAKRLLPNRRVVPTPKPADLGPGPAAEHDRGDAVDTDALLDFAGKCEGLRIGVIERDRFMDQVWE